MATGQRTHSGLVLALVLGKLVERTETIAEEMDLFLCVMTRGGNQMGKFNFLMIPK